MTEGPTNPHFSRLPRLIIPVSVRKSFGPHQQTKKSDKRLTVKSGVSISPVNRGTCPKLLGHFLIGNHETRRGPNIRLINSDCINLQQRLSPKSVLAQVPLGLNIIRLYPDINLRDCVGELKI